MYQLSRILKNSLMLPMLFVGLVAILSACNTMEGLGRDVKQGGKSLENSADRHKP